MRLLPTILLVATVAALPENPADMQLRAESTALNDDETLKDSEFDQALPVTALWHRHRPHRHHPHRPHHHHQHHPHRPSTCKYDRHCRYDASCGSEPSWCSAEAKRRCGSDSGCSRPQEGCHLLGSRPDGGPVPDRHGKCWLGGQGASCGGGHDCMKLVNGKGVCRYGKCQNGGFGASCGGDHDCNRRQCIHGTCRCTRRTDDPGRWMAYRHGGCQDGSHGKSCGSGYDCQKLVNGRAVCRGGRCLDGRYGDSCGHDGDCNGRQCVSGVCRCEKRSDKLAWQAFRGHPGKCQDGLKDALCGGDHDCQKIVNGKGVCRNDKCQDGSEGASCGDNDHCTIPKSCSSDKCFAECRPEGVCKVHTECRWTDGSHARDHNNKPIEEQCVKHRERSMEEEWGECKKYGCGENGVHSATRGQCHRNAETADGHWGFYAGYYDCTKDWKLGPQFAKCCDKKFHCCIVNFQTPKDTCQKSILRYRFGCAHSKPRFGRFGASGCDDERIPCDKMSWSDRAGSRCGRNVDPAWSWIKEEVIDISKYAKDAFQCEKEGIQGAVGDPGSAADPGDSSKDPRRKNG